MASAFWADIGRLRERVAAYFRSGAAAQELDYVVQHIPAALPYIDLAAQIVTTLTPTGLDDAMYAQLKRKFPRLFDGTIKTGDELKLYALAVAAELLGQRYPTLSTSALRGAVQLAYISKKE
jgi:hypothetical protein